MSVTRRPATRLARPGRNLPGDKVLADIGDAGAAHRRIGQLIGSVDGQLSLNPHVLVFTALLKRPDIVAAGLDLSDVDPGTGGSAPLASWAGRMQLCSRARRRAGRTSMPFGRLASFGMASLRFPGASLPAHLACRNLAAAPRTC